jgi:tetratricopeptide (TPR) repeat protein
VTKVTPPPPPKEPKEAKEPKLTAKESRHSHAAAPSKDDDDFAPVKVSKKDAARVEAPSSAQASAAYKAKDFATAERLYRLEASKQSGKQMEKTIAFANDVRALRLAMEKGDADAAKNAGAAIADYQQAMSIDNRIGHGQHAQFFKGKIGKLQVPLAQQAFAAGKYEQAFQAAQQAQRAGAGDGGVMKQLEAKAKELTDKGAAVQRSNPAQAKTYWHQVIKIVPTSSPSYARAYQLLNQGGGGSRDQDED